MNARYPSRIVCLTEETVETLYLLGCGDAVVGVSGFTVRPAEARKKPRISTYTEANFDAIVSLRPDVVLAFSDLQAEIVKELMLRGLQVVGFNQRSVDDILCNILVIGALVGKSQEAEHLVETFERNLHDARVAGNAFARDRESILRNGMIQ